ncbi:MAG: thioredoxin family protein [Propionicimonas sp.]
MNTRLALATIIPATFALLLTGCSQGGTTMDKPAAPASAMEKESTPAAMEKGSPEPSAMSSDSMAKDDAMEGAGAYVTLADYQASMAEHAGSTVVYFFHAGWCPDCKAADSALTTPGVTIPMGVTIVKVDYDTATDLKRRYGVTMQHTFVQVDGAGEPVRTWAGKTVDTILVDLKG